LKGDTDFSHNEDVEWAPECRGDAEPHGHATTGQGIHNRVDRVQICDRTTQELPGLATVGEPHVIRT
jgi:hypothetical protein